jgi:CubicO group peptidase (beta-lactamase class C family)
VKNILHGQNQNLIKYVNTAFFDGFAKKHPVYAPSTSPIYSNVAYQILAYALEGITGQPFERMLDCDIINKLNLTHTSLKTPRNSSFGVIPNSITPSSLSSETTSGWNQQLGDEGP